MGPRSKRIGRRPFVTSGLGGLAGLAGCLGSDVEGNSDSSDDPDDDGGEPPDDTDGEPEADEPEDSEAEDGETERTLRLRTSRSATTLYAVSEGLAEAVGDRRDDPVVETQPGESTESNLEALATGAADLVTVENWTVNGVHAGIEPYDEFDVELAQVLHVYDLPWFFVTPDDGLETLSDVDAGATVSPTPAGSAVAPLLERALEHAVTDYDRVSENYSTQGAAMNEGRLDVGVGTLLNGDIAPGWLREAAATTDVRVLDVDEATADAWADDDRLRVRTVDTDRVDRARTVGEIPAPTLSYGFVARADLEADLVSAFLEAIFEARSELATYHGVLRYYEDEAFWVENAFDDVPFHPAAAEFYAERGVWRDEFDRV